MFDFVIKNGTICDGTGEPSYKADIGIEGERITFIGEIDTAVNCPQINAEGMTVTPGFIDPHTHVDLSLLFAPKQEPYLKQGVTTVVTGNCGYGLAPQNDKVFYGSFTNLQFLSHAGADEFDLLPLIFEKEKAKEALKERYDIDLDWKTFAEYNEKCDKLPLGCNVAPLTGYSAVRTAVMGKDCLREASPLELDALEKLTRECMEAGAFGLSSGRDPIYLPGPYATEKEMIRMLKVVASYDGIFSSHTFNTDSLGRPDRMAGYREMFRQAQGANVRTNVSHVHVTNMANRPSEAVRAAEKTLTYFDQVQREGLDLSYDVIPSPSCGDYTLETFGFYIKPLVLMSGSRKQLAENFKLPEFRRMVRQVIKSGKMSYLDADEEGNWLCELCILAHKDTSLIGKNMSAYAKEKKLTPLDAMMNLFAEDPDMIADLIAPDFDEAVALLCRNKIAMPCSDGSSYTKETNLTGHSEIPVYPNTMNISYIPRYLTKYVSGAFEQAVHQASGLVAERFGIKKRGEIKLGYYADLVILNKPALHSFDEESNPLKDPLGIEWVIINGQVVVEEGCLTENNPGKVLRKR